MATEYSDEIKEAAKTLHIDGANSAEIRARLVAGTAGLPYTSEPSERTIDKWRSKWKKQGIRAGYSVRAGDEDAVENAIYRRLLGLTRAKLGRLEDIETRGDTDMALAKEIGILQSVIDAARAKRQTYNKRAQGLKLEPSEGSELGQASGQGAGSSILGRLAGDDEDQDWTGHTEPSSTNSSEADREAVGA